MANYANLCEFIANQETQQAALTLTSSEVSVIQQTDCSNLTEDLQDYLMSILQVFTQKLDSIKLIDNRLLLILFKPGLDLGELSLMEENTIDSYLKATF